MSLTLEASVINNVNYAACHCKAQLISSIRMKGEKGQEFILNIRSVPKFLYEYKEKMVLDKNQVTLSDIELHLDDAFYRQEMIEAKEGIIQIEVCDANETDKVLAFENKPVHLQPYLHWNRSEYEGSLIAFMQPNDPLVARVLNRAGEFANAENGRMVGYQNWSNSSVAKQAEWIYRALQEENLHYLCPPAGFEFGESGQKVRIPGMVLHDEVKQGTCLDLAILYASCLEAASLHSMLFLIHGHAFAGVSLDESEYYSDYPMKDWQSVHSSVGAKILPIECTFFTDGLNCSFDQAVAAGNNHLNEPTIFQCVLDVYSGRLKGYVPAYTFTDQPICDFGKDSFHMNPSTYGQNKWERLIKQSMDFSLKNALLSKNALSEELCFKIDGKKLFNNNYTDAELFEVMQNCCTNKKDVDDILYNLSRIERQEKQETGRSIIYLTVNELEWTPKGQKDKRRAPLYLFPAEIYRNIRGEYRFRTNTDESFFNPVLKAYLYQEYGIDLSGILDAPENEYADQIKMIVYAVGKQTGWKVIENCAGLGAYRVQNQAIWKGLQDEQLLEHDVVHGIIDGAMTWDNDIEEAEDAKDKSKVYAYQADRSQSEVIDSTFKKRAQVIFGPAGNGKSQTIANIITEHMRNGQSVLFVTEKPAAMEVVAQMLDQAELTPFYLMLPDGKASVAGLHEKVEATLRYIANYHYKNTKADYQKKLYADAIERLKKYHDFMKAPVVHGYSLSDLLEEHETYVFDEYDLVCENAGEALNHEQAESIIAAFAEIMKNHPDVQTEYLPFIRCLEMTEDEQKKAKELVEQALEKFSVLEQKMEQLSEKLGIGLSDLGEKEKLQRIMIYASGLQKCPVYGPTFKVEAKKDDAEFTELLHLTRELMHSTPGSYHYEDVGEVLWTKVDEYEQNQKSTDWSSFDKFAIQHPLTGITPEQMRMIKQKQDFDKYCTQFLKQADGRPKNERALLLNAIIEIVQGNGEDLLEQIGILNLIYKSYIELQKKAEAAVICNGEAFALQYPEKMKADLFRTWKKCQDQLIDVKLYMTNYEKAKEIGLGDMLHRMETLILKDQMTIEDMIPAFRKGRCKYNIDKVCKEHPEWLDFTHVDYTVCLNQYRENEEVLRNAYRKQLIDELVSHMPNLNEGSADAPELGALQRLIRRDSKQTSTYKIFEEASNALRQIFPCMMMGPESVAEYIPSDVNDYDIVIFDEASQLPTYKALIPIAKGKKCLFIGDEKQLTPTTFFKKNILNEDGTETPEEAILEDAIITSMPQKLLRYHYRSQHENLVAFSNEHYYHGEIVTFPGCDTQIKGVQYIYVEDGCYDRGGARNNHKEAEKVLELVQSVYKELPEDTEETLGIITFNIEQMKLIHSMIRNWIREDKAYGRQMEELVDVVNLEACQGKEWDRTILSTAYGPDKDGNFSSNLGPMTRDDGGNRLNVMITRSRKQLYVVTSMTPEMFGDEQKAGNKDLRDFLAFAKGDLKLDSRETGAGKDCTGIAQSVVNQLEEKGYQVHTNIGSSSCKVDIGVVNEDGISYKLGILLDHFEHDRYDVCDEEVVIPGILESKGWKIYRLHALNWYANKDYEMEQIKKMLNN